MDAPERKAHLSDLFKSGKDLIIEDGEGNEYALWVQRPSSIQQDEARATANARAVKIRLQYKNEDSDHYVSMRAQFDDIEDKDELLDFRVRYSDNDRSQQAFSEVLFGDEGSDWESEEKNYMALLDSISSRYEEIQRFNQEMAAAGSEEAIDIEGDEELKDLLERQEQFAKEVAEVKEVLDAEERKLHVNKPLQQLRNEVIKETIETEAKLYWYEQYQTRMVYFAVRFPDDHDKLYFSRAEDVLELPTFIKDQVWNAYEEVERGAEDLKNSLSLPSSSPSSEQ